jgi:hypothetical protein
VTPSSLGVDDPGALRRRWHGTHDVDPWGLDPDLVDLLSPLARARFRIEVDHEDRLPGAGPALLVANRPRGLSAPFVLARGVRLATGRFVRMVGVPDVAPVGPVLRRLGGVLARPDEVAGVLRAGQVAGVLLDHRGRAPRALVEPAFELGVPVVPAALLGHELGRRWRVALGAPRRAEARPGPLAVAELLDRLTDEIEELLRCRT